MRRTSGKARWAAWMLIGICLIFLGSTVAQEQEKSSGADSDSQEQVQSSPQAKPSHDGGPHLGRELAKESREAAGEDENAQFKRSGAVKFVARITNLSMEHAYWFCLIVNFGIVAGFIVWMSKKSLPGVFRNRTAQIQQAMEEARRASAEANQRLSDIAARLSRLDTEIGEMRGAAEKEAAAEETRIKAAAEEDSRKIVQAAEQEIAAAAKAARRDLKAYAASLAVSLAGKQIRVDQAADQALVRDFAAQLAEDGKSGRGDN
jgi:F-type H+-transporting ATPase subunit b